MLRLRLTGCGCCGETGGGATSVIGKKMFFEINIELSQPSIDYRLRARLLVFTNSIFLTSIICMVNAKIERKACVSH